MPMDKQEKQDRRGIIYKGINDFLVDHELDFSRQTKKRINRHLMGVFEDESSISASKVNEYLSDILEYFEHTRLHIDSEDGSYRYDMLKSLILSADKKVRNPAKPWLIIILILSLFSMWAFSFLYSTFQNNQISITQIEELKELAKNVVDLEERNNNKTSSTSVWNTVKDLEDIKKHGYKSSYKKFSYRQYKIAKRYLLNWDEKAASSAVSIADPNTLYFISSDLDVVDGDTFHAKGEKYRLWGVDAFEMKQKCLDSQKQEYLCGVRSKEALYAILNEATDIGCAVTAKDRYGRSVVKCSIDGEALGTLLAQSGWALDYEKYSGGEFQNDQRRAKMGKLGAWSGCFVKPWDYRHKENLDVCKK